MTTQTAHSSTPSRLPLSALRESPTNPRTLFQRMEELADSIRTNGVIQPLIVRPLATPEKGVTHEIIIGARRFRASKLARVPDVPVDIRVLDDDAADDIQQIENLQREDLGPLEEAQGFARLVAKPGQSIESVAKRVGKPPQYVAGQLSLLNLTKEAREAFAQDQIGEAHALKLASLPETLQKDGLNACFAQPWNRTGLLPVGQLEKWIERNVLLSLKNVPFDISAVGLVSQAGSCDACSKRTGANTLLFPAVADDSCLDRKCLQAKVAAHIETLQHERPELVRISMHAYADTNGVLGTQSFVIVKPKKGSKKPENQRCDSMRDALVVQGHDAGAEHIVCADRTCKIHHAQAAQAQKQNDARRQQMRDEEREKKLRMATRRAIGDAILRKFKTPSAVDWRLMTASMVHHLPHEYRIDLAKRHGCYPKMKQPTGGHINGALAKYIETLDASACHRLLFDIALMPDIRNQYSSQADPNLKAQAKRFHVDAAAIAREVRTNASATQKAVKTKSKGGAA